MTSMQGPIEVTSLRDPIEKVTSVVTQEPKIVWFRGESTAGWDLQAGVSRKYDKVGERNLTNRFRARAGTRHSSLVPDYRD
jgi:hypothetical protein